MKISSEKEKLILKSFLYKQELILYTNFKKRTLSKGWSIFNKIIKKMCLYK